MFSKLAVIASLAIFAVATPTPGGQPSSGTNLCCDQTQTAGSAAGVALLSSIGVVVQDLTAIVGSDCSPITVSSTVFPGTLDVAKMDCRFLQGVGVSGTSCTNDPVNCQNFEGECITDSLIRCCLIF